MGRKKSLKQQIPAGKNLTTLHSTLCFAKTSFVLGMLYETLSEREK